MADCGTGTTTPQRTACIPGLRFLLDPTEKPYNTSGGTVYERTGRICLESEPFSLRRTRLNDLEPPKNGRLFLCSRIKRVSYTPYSPDILPVSISPEFLPDTVNHTFDLGIHTHRDVIPDCLVDLFPCKNLSRMLPVPFSGIAK